MRITRKVEFDMAHRLPDHEGKCRRLHGHRYVVEVAVEGDVLQSGPSNGMVIDFTDVDAMLDAFVKRFDHFTMLYAHDPLFLAMQDAGIDTGAQSEYGVLGMLFVPTAENLAQYFLDTLVRQEFGACEVTVWETPRSSASARVPSAQVVQ